MDKKRIKKFIILLIFLISLTTSFAQEGVPDLPDISINIGEQVANNRLSTYLEILLVITVLSIAPGLLMLLTSFTRITIVLSFLKQALGTRQAPPNQVMIALALFLTIMIMFPVFTNVYDNAIVPYNNNEISYDTAIDNAWQEFKVFMLREITYHKNQDNIYMLSSSLKVPIENIEDTPFQILIPAFALSEVEIAFKMGILIYLPFIIIDMIVASILLSMGMMMIPPVLISLPFKLLLFVVINGWDLVIGSLVRSFMGG